MLIIAKVIYMIPEFRMQRMNFDILFFQWGIYECIVLYYILVNLHGMSNKPENVMLSPLLHSDVFKRIRHNFMSHLTVINVLTIPCLLNTIVKDFVTCSSLCPTCLNEKREIKKTRTIRRYSFFRKEDKSLLFNIAESLYSGYKERTFKNRKTRTYICDYMIDDIILYVIIYVYYDSKFWHCKGSRSITRLFDALVTSFCFITLPRIIAYIA